jgi:hypothetical protein
VKEILIKKYFINYMDDIQFIYKKNYGEINKELSKLYMVSLKINNYENDMYKKYSIDEFNNVVILLNKYTRLKIITTSYITEMSTISEILTSSKTEHPLWKYSFIKKYKNILVPNSITKLKPIRSTFYQIYDILCNTMNTEYTTILDMGIAPNIIEYIALTNKNNKIEYDFIHTHNKYIVCDKLHCGVQPDNYMNAFYRLLYPHKNIKFTELANIIGSINPNDYHTLILKKYDIIFMDLNIYYPHVLYLPTKPYTRINLPQTIYTILINLKHLNKNGQMYAMINHVNSLLYIDLLYILNNIFDKVTLYIPEIHEPSSFNHSLIHICSGFKGYNNSLNKIIDDLFKLDVDGKYKLSLCYVPDSDLNTFNPLSTMPYRDNFKDPVIIDKYRENCKDFKYLHRILNIPTDDLKYKKIIDYVNDFYVPLYVRSINRLKEISNIIDKKKAGTFLEKDELYYKTRQLNESISMAKKLNLPLKKNYQIIDQNELKKLLICDLLKHIPFQKFKINNKNIKINTKLIQNSKYSKIDLLDTKSNKIYKMTYLNLDTRDLDIYSEARFTRRYYSRGKLPKYLRKKCNVKNITQAGCKMWELLMNLPLINKSSNTINTLHLCELPGSFIYATDLYLNTKTKCTNWNWTAQSLWESDKNKFDDSFGLASNNKNNYDFGNGTGDITLLTNILHYEQKIHNIQKLKLNLITSDCGMSLQDDESSQILLFGSLLTILLCCNKGTSFVQKMYPPINSFHMMMFMIISAQFEEMYFAKPAINNQSTEFYICGINFKNDRLDEKLRDLLIEMYKEFFETEKLNESLILELKKMDYSEINEGLSNIGQLFADEINITIDLSEMMDKLTEKEKQLIKENDTLQQQKWITNNKFPNKSNKSFLSNKKNEIKYVLAN